MTIKIPTALCVYTQNEITCLGICAINAGQHDNSCGHKFCVQRTLLYVKMVLIYLCWCLLESIHCTSFSSSRFTRLPFSTWLHGRSSARLWYPLPELCPLPVHCPSSTLQPSPGTFLSPCLPDSQAPGSLHYDKAV